MSQGALTCSRCGGLLEEGFLGDVTPRGVEPSEWIAGAPEASLLWGTKTGGKRRHPVRSFRCTHCGHLECFAGVEAAEAAQGIECLACGAYIPAAATACPACGWTWEDTRE